MPKVSGAHRERQATRIRTAAERCFARNGFHATSMDEIIAEADMSSSTVYRYYPGGKQQLVHAVSAARIGPLLHRITTLADSEQPVGPERAFVEAMGLLWSHAADVAPDEGDREQLLQLTRVAINAWGELARDPEVRHLLQENYAAIRTQLTGLVRRWKDTGVVTAPLEPAEIATLMQNTAFGVIVEQAITGYTDIPAAAKRFAILLDPKPPDDPDPLATPKISHRTGPNTPRE